MWRVALAIVLVSSAAHAMGANVAIDIRAWNADGTAALLEKRTAWDGQLTLEYVVVATDASEPLAVTLGDTDAHGKIQRLDPTACTRDARALASSLAAHHMRGVTVHADRCSAGPVVEVATATATSATHAWIDAATPRAAAALAAFTPVYGGDGAIEVATATGKLVLVRMITGSGTPTKTQLEAFVAGATGLTRLHDVT